MSKSGDRRLKRFVCIALILCVALSGLFAAGAFADDSPRRAQKIWLKGELKKDTPKSVTIADLEKLPLTTYETYNPFVRGRESYTGILLKDLVSAYGTKEVGVIVFTAIDDYEVALNSEEWNRLDIMLATQVEGRHLEVKDSGPVKVVLPYDDIVEKEQGKYHRKWIWLIKRMTFKSAGWQEQSK